MVQGAANKIKFFDLEDTSSAGRFCSSTTLRCLHGQNPTTSCPPRELISGTAA